MVGGWCVEVCDGTASNHHPRHIAIHNTTHQHAQHALGGEHGVERLVLPVEDEADEAVPLGEVDGRGRVAQLDADDAGVHLVWSGLCVYVCGGHRLDACVHIRRADTDIGKDIDRAVANEINKQAVPWAGAGSCCGRPS